MSFAKNFINKSFFSIVDAVVGSMIELQSNSKAQ